MVKELLKSQIYYKTKISQSEYKILESAAIYHLDVKNIYALKDKFDGERYFKQFLQRSFAEIAYQNFKQKKFFDIDQKMNKNFKPDFNEELKSIEIIDCSFDELPKIPDSESDFMVFCYVNVDFRDVWIIGGLESSILKQMCKEHLLSPVYRKNFLGVLSDLSILREIK